MITRKLLIFFLPVIFVIGICFSALSINFDSLDGDPAFEEAVRIIKKYETLHKAKNWPYIGYGHRVLPGENYKKGVVLKEAEAEKLLRKDLKKYINLFKSQGDKALILGVLSYNIGPNAVKKSHVMSLINSSKDKLREAYVKHCRYKGKVHNQIKRRRIEEFDTLYAMITTTSTSSTGKTKAKA